MKLTNKQKSMKCDRCNRHFHYTKMFHFKTIIDGIYENFNHLCKKCYEHCWDEMYSNRKVKK